MNLVHTFYNLEISIIENMPNVIVIEHPKAFSDIILDIWRQTSGESGGFILSNKDKELNITKEIIFVDNPFSASCNDRKVLTKIYQEISCYIAEKYLETFANINQATVSLLDNLNMELPYNIDFSLDMSAENLCKMYDVKINTDTCTLLEQLCDYVSIMHKVCKINIFAFLNLKNYLSVDEISLLYEHINNEKVNVLLFEGSYKEKYENEKIWILDKDLCIIELSEDNNTSSM